MKCTIALITSVLIFFCFNANADSKIVQKKVSEIVTDFARWSDKQLDDNLAKNKPSVRIETSPYLIYIEYEENRITAPNWDDTPKEVKSLFASFSPEGQLEALFKLCFNQFFVAHEAAHWLQNNYDLLDATNFYASEQMANRIAVEYWSSSEEGRALLKRMASYAEYVLTKLKDPTPEGFSPEVYFTENYQKLASTPEKYAYYQFYFVKKAIQDREKFTVKGIVKK